MCVARGKGRTDGEKKKKQEKHAFMPSCCAATWMLDFIT